MQFLDTNIFIRYLTGDDPQKAQACRALFLKADQDEVALTTSESVIAEIVFVLTSKHLYNVPRNQVRAILYPLLTMRGLKITHRNAYLRALDIFATSYS
jgi:predicted nucleic acid-binding protein